MTTFGSPIARSRCCRPGDLDVVGLVAVEGEAVGVGGHEREALDRAPQAEVAVGRVEREADAAERAGARGVRAPVVVERAHPHALLAQQVEVDVGDRAPVAVGEALGLGEQHAVLVDHRLAVPRQVGRRLALARPRRRRRRPGSASDAERHSSLRSSARPTVIGLPDRLSSTVAPASAASALGGIGTHMSSQTSTWTTRPGTSSAANSRSGPNGTSAPPTRISAALVVARARAAGARRTRGRSAGRTSGRRRARGRGGRRPRSCRPGCGGAAARRRRAPAAGRRSPRPPSRARASTPSSTASCSSRSSIE